MVVVHWEQVQPASVSALLLRLAPSRPAVASLLMNYQHRRPIQHVNTTVGLKWDFQQTLMQKLCSQTQGK